jgi:hypothetical protein
VGAGRVGGVSSREPPPWSADEGAPSEPPGPGRGRRRHSARGPPGGRDAALEGRREGAGGMRDGFGRAV